MACALGAALLAFGSYQVQADELTQSRVRTGILDKCVYGNWRAFDKDGKDVAKICQCTTKKFMKGLKKGAWKQINPKARLPRAMRGTYAAAFKACQ